MMKVRTAYGKFVFILFFCFTLFSVLEAAPRNGTVTVGLDMGGGNLCLKASNAAILNIPANIFSASGTCKENNAGPDISFNISATFTDPAGDGSFTGTLTQSLNGGAISNFNFSGSWNNLFFSLLFPPGAIAGTFEALSAEPIPTLSQWNIMLLIFLLSVTIYFKGIKQS